MSTAVSAFYVMKSKYPSHNYLSWIRLFLENIQCQLVFYTTSDLIPIFLEMRKNNPFYDRTIFIDLPEDKFYAYSRYGRNFWKNQITIDPEAVKHSPELYAIWYEKKEFVKRTIETNPFSSDKFIWCDAGCLRYPQWTPNVYNFGQEKNIPDDKMLLLQVFPFTEEEINQETPRKFEIVNRIGGGIQAGSIKAWEKWYDIYDKQLQMYNKYGKFIGKDQSIMAEIVLNYPDLVEIVHANKNQPDVDKWFTLLFYLSNPPLVSILIPLYNGIEYLAETLNSIKQQTYNNYEILIGVNGHRSNSEIFQQAVQMCIESFGNCEEIVEIERMSKLLDLSFKIMTGQNMKYRVFDFHMLKGKSATMNKLVNYINGEWISLLDADDVWTFNKLEVQSKYFSKYDVIGSHYIYFGSYVGSPNIPMGDISNEDFWKFNPLGNSCTTFHRKLLSEETWNPENSGLDDYELWLTFRYGRSDVKFWNCSEKLMKHRIYPTSSYNTTNNDRLAEFLEQMKLKLKSS